MTNDCAPSRAAGVPAPLAGLGGGPPGRQARPPERVPRILISLALALAALPGGVAAQEAVASDPGRIVGVVADAVTGEPVAAAHVRVRELGRSDFSHGDGSFHLERIPEGAHRVVVERLGYATHEELVQVRSGETTELSVRLRPSAITLAGIVVTGAGRERGVHETYQPTSVLSGEELNRRLTPTLAGTIRHQPGIAMQSFGPAPAQPVIRGLGGDRVLVLEDGHRTGDMSTTGPDHAVGIDPVTAGRIEVLRGPAGLLYGSSALGGVVNVIREEVPRSLPERFEGMASAQGESVNTGLTGAARFAVPLQDRFALRGELSLRRGEEVRTPLGELPGTHARGYNAAAGGSWLPAWGFVGLAFRDYRLDHGVPGEFNGQLIPGAHSAGAELETQRRVGRFEMGHFAGLGPFSAVELEGNLVHYEHAEFELSPVTGDRFAGTSFDQLTGTLNLAARHDHERHAFREEGALGVFLLHRDLVTGGSFPGTRDSREWNLAGFLFEEVLVGPFRVQAGARYDWHRIEPTDPSPIDAGEEIRQVRTRTFGDVSASLAGLWEFGRGWTFGTSVARAFRAPSVQELFSAGPHLADYSYDIGNPDLDTEVGLGTEIFVRINRSEVSAEATVFRNAISNFIHYRPTAATRCTLVSEGGQSFTRCFPVFEARGEDAVFVGAEGRAQWEVVPGLVLDGTLSWVRADYQVREEPLPQIPPLNGAFSVRWDDGRWFVQGGWEGAASQNRVPRPVEHPDGEDPVILERPTPGHGLVELGGGIRWSEGDRRHSIVLNVHNALDREWRDHLSRAKEVAPEPGRNLQLLYRISF
jgi:iron complex outermembrane recepter protein